MKMAKRFKNGHGQAVRLPKEFRFEGDSVHIHQLGSHVVRVPKHDPWRSLFEATAEATEDFMKERGQGAPQERESFN